jgi:peptidoglycan/LPS O-acetylase OafA/YrhL
MEAGDALRALAALMVVVYHVLLGASIAAGTPMREAYGSVVGTIGGHLNAGLYVFFALTGYFAGKADEEPVAQMDVLHLRIKHGGRGVYTARQCVCG